MRDTIGSRAWGLGFSFEGLGSGLDRAGHHRARRGAGGRGAGADCGERAVGGGAERGHARVRRRARVEVAGADGLACVRVAEVDGGADDADTVADGGADVADAVADGGAGEGDAGGGGGARGGVGAVRAGLWRWGGSGAGGSRMGQGDLTVTYGWEAEKAGGRRTRRQEDEAGMVVPQPDRSAVETSQLVCSRAHSCNASEP